MDAAEPSRGRRADQNILREAPGPTGHAKRYIVRDSPLSAWELFIDNFVLNHIRKCTLAEADRQGNDKFCLSFEELRAFVAIFYARGVSGTNDHSVHGIWSKSWGVPCIKEIMSRNRFFEILRYLRFDEKSSRSERLKTDKFALFSTVWDRFIDNSIASYKPGAFMTVDEQLFPSKARCPFTQYMPDKPDSFGHKYWVAVDKDSKFIANAFLYLGKDHERPNEQRLSEYVVMKLMSPYLKKGRNVTTDNYFTSVLLANQLKAQGTSLVGTLNRIRREVPKEIRNLNEPLHSSKIYKTEGITLTVYQAKAKKNVLLLSSLHPDVEVDLESVKKTPETVKFYNKTKVGVDIVDQMARKYTTRTCVRRWPVHCFQNTLDLAGINAWFVYRETTCSKMSRKKFLQKLIVELADPYVRAKKKRGLEDENSDADEPKQTKYCQIQSLCKKNRTVGSCNSCKKSLCGQCTAVTKRKCVKCSGNEA